MTTNQNITLTGNTKQSVLLETSTSFIVQNTSDSLLRFKIKDSDIQSGGVINGYDIDRFSFYWSMEAR